MIRSNEPYEYFRLHCMPYIYIYEIIWWTFPIVCLSLCFSIIRYIWNAFDMFRKYFNTVLKYEKKLINISNDYDAKCRLQINQDLQDIEDLLKSLKSQ